MSQLQCDRSPLSSDLESEVRRRYAAGAEQVQPRLCCPVREDATDLAALLPREIIEKDYGCGAPWQHAQAGEVVVDLGSGAGKACYLLARTVGPSGRVIGLDFNNAMLALARGYEGEIAGKLGYQNFEFRKARIQDMALDLEAAEAWLRRYRIESAEHLIEFEAHCQRLRREQPLLADASVDLIVSNCVLNLVRPEDKTQLFREMHRVLKRGGRAVISDIVCDEDPTPAILNDPELWSGCVAGAFREDHFLDMFNEAGFYGIEILSRQEQPWQVIDGIEFRSTTVRAFRGKEGPCLERNQAVIYKGPWKQVRDDDDHVLNRGQRLAVCDKTFKLMTDPAGPYAREIAAVLPLEDVSMEKAQPFDCRRTSVRHPRETKGREYRITRTNHDSPCCPPGSSCC